MKICKIKIALSVLLLFAVAVPVFAYVYNQTQEYTKYVPVAIVIRLPMPAQFGIYWDYECTKPVTVIDFGEIPQPRMWMYLSKYIYIRNEQADKRIWVYWNSTLRDVTTEITESWISNGTMIDASQIYYSYYSLSIPPKATLGTYNWTLTIWADY